MKSIIKLFLILISITVFMFAWLTHQLANTNVQLLIIVLVAVSLVAFLTMNLLDRREEQKKRAKRESRTGNKSLPPEGSKKRTDTSFALRDRKSGLSWGGGNIKASEATRGTKRKFLGKG